MWSPDTASFVTARRLRRLRLVVKAPALVISVAARSSTALRTSVAARSALGASVTRSGVGCATGLRATAAASLALAASELSLVAVRVEVVCAVAVVEVEANSFFSTGLLVSVDAAFGASSDFLVSAFSSFLDSAFASLFSVAAGVSATSDFSVAGADVSEVATGVDRSTFGTGAPSPYALSV